MEIKDIVENIPKEIYNDILEVCSITFINGRSIYAEELLEERIIKNERIWEFFRKIDNTEYNTFEIQTYIALEKILKEDKKSIVELINQLYNKWDEDEAFNDRRFTIMHQINKFYPKEFNLNIIKEILQDYLSDINKENEITIAQSFINEAFPKLGLMLAEDWSIGIIYRGNVIEDILKYIGIDIVKEFEKVKYKNYEIILKNKMLYKDKDNISQNIMINMEKFSEDEYILEMLNEEGFIDRINLLYNELVNVINYITNDYQKDYYLFLGTILN